MNASGMYKYTDFHPIQVNKSLDLRKDIYPAHTRTQRWPRYYIIDFGSVKAYDPREGFPEASFDDAVAHVLPEFRNRENRTTYNPFPADIYCLGRFIERDLLRTAGLAFLRRLTIAMMTEEPSQRPTIDEVRQQFVKSVQSLTPLHLRSPLKGAGLLKHLKKQLSYALKRLPPFPKPQFGNTLEPFDEEIRAFFTMTRADFAEKARHDEKSILGVWKATVKDDGLVPEKHSFDPHHTVFYTHF
uniref:Protein kinase domain-containing protein n=1 Tax=Moniliophthora roreri TaxID=221103 RepID=A0A0W0GCU1_MONRR